VQAGRATGTGEPLRRGKWRWAPDKRAMELGELGGERRVPSKDPPRGVELAECRDEGLGHVRPAELAELSALEQAHRTASTNARMRAGSLMPGATSSPRLASTHQGRTARTASATLSGPSPPPKTTRPSLPAARLQWSGSSSSQGRSRTRATGRPLCSN